MITSAHIFPGAEVLEHGNCGYPTRGAKRRLAPAVLGVTHITGNSNLPSALAEVKFSARVGSGASFPFCVNRNGTVVQGFDPFLYAPWTNGDINKPDLSEPLVAAMARSAFNPNEHCLITIENVGFGAANPLTDAQIQANASIYAWAARIAGTRDIEVETVLGHRLINTVTRWNCPTSGDLMALRRRIVRRANALLGAVPDTAIDEDEEDLMPTILRRVVGQEALIIPHTELRVEPRYGAESSSTTEEGGRVVQPYAVVQGDWYKIGAEERSREWLVFLNAKGQPRYFPLKRADARPIGMTGDVERELADTKAALTAANAALKDRRAWGREIAELALKVAG